MNFIENPSQADIKKGELVFTAATKDAAFPPDIAVAKVVSIDRRNGDLEPDVALQPVVDLDRLVFVKVLRWPETGFEWRLTAPRRRDDPTHPTVPGRRHARRDPDDGVPAPPVLRCDAGPLPAVDDRGGVRGRARHRRHPRLRRAAWPSTCSSRRRSGSRPCRSRSSATWWASSRGACCARPAGSPRCSAASAAWPAGRCSWSSASIAGEDGLLTGHSIKIIVAAAIYDAVLAPVIFPIGRWACHDTDTMRL